MVKIAKTPEQKALIKKIMDGKIYCRITKVAPSGMSRCMRFYYVKKDRIVNCTDEIHDLNNYGTMTKDWDLRVGGCGMDMIFATLYYSLPQNLARKWSQRYSKL